MSFKPSNMASPFSRASGGNDNARRPLPTSLIVRVDSWDVGNRKLLAVIQDGPFKGDMGSFSISQKSIESGLKAEQRRRANPQAEERRVPWAGWRIDSDMAAHFQPGALLVIERAQEMGAAAARADGTKNRSFEAWRIANTQQDSPEKVFPAIVTISTYENRIFQLQRWAEQAFLLADHSAVREVANRLDEISQQLASNEYPPTLGVQFRVVVPSADAREPHTAIDLSPPFDYIARQRDAEGNETAPGRPLDSETFLQLVQDYKEQYVDVKFPQHEFPTAYIEATTYRNYRGSRLSNYLAVSDREFDPIHVMATTKSKLAQDDAEYVNEKNFAVRGIVQITADQADEATRSFIPRNFVYRLHADGRRDHVQTFILGHDGRRVTMAQELRPVLKPTTPREGQGASQGYNQGYNQGGNQGGNQAPASRSGWGNRAAETQQGGTWNSAPAAAPASSGLDQGGEFGGGWGDAFEDMDEGNPFGDLGDARANLRDAKNNFGA